MEINATPPPSSNSGNGDGPVVVTAERIERGGDSPVAKITEVEKKDVDEVNGSAGAPDPLSVTVDIPKQNVESLTASNNEAEASKLDKGEEKLNVNIAVDEKKEVIDVQNNTKVAGMEVGNLSTGKTEKFGEAAGLTEDNPLNCGSEYDKEVGEGGAGVDGPPSNAGESLKESRNPSSLSDNRSGRKKIFDKKNDNEGFDPAPFLARREKRKRKSVEPYTPEIMKEKERVICTGTGLKLEEIPNVVENFKEITWSNPHLKMLYSIVFGKGKKKEFKAHLLQFSGIVYPEKADPDAEKEKVKRKMYKLQLDDLKSVMDLCDIDRSSESLGRTNPSKEILCNRFLEWLEEPNCRDKNKKGTANPKRSPKRSLTQFTSLSAKAKKRKEYQATTKSPVKKRPVKKSNSKTAESHAISANHSVEFNIPGASIARIREKVQSIVKNSDRETLTVKGVRQLLELWLDTDLSDHKDEVRALVMETIDS